MNIKEKFLELTSKTYPHGKESELFGILPSNLEYDGYGNRYINIPIDENTQSSVMFTSHLDTATREDCNINHVFEGDIIKTDGTSILGADDKAGVTIMLYMIHNKIPGLYYFFLGEEVGCLGSKHLASVMTHTKLDHINKVISFDRRGTQDVITFQSSKRSCSDTFASALAGELNKHSESVTDNDTVFNYRKDDTGVYTDSAEFTSIYSECTNISVGYYSEHTHTERQDIKHLDKLAKVCLLVDWENLPTERDPSKTEYKTYSYHSTYHNYDYSKYKRYNYNNFYDSAEEEAYCTNGNKKTIDTVQNFYFHDKRYNFVSTIEINLNTSKYVSLEFCNERISSEADLICEFVRMLEVPHSSMTWNGLELVLTYSDSSKSEIIHRHELERHIKELNFHKEYMEDNSDTYKELIGININDDCPFDKSPDLNMDNDMFAPWFNKNQKLLSPPNELIIKI